MRNSTSIERAKHEAIRELFFKLKKENPEIIIREAADIIVKSAAPRFFCNYEYAVRMVSLLNRGKELPITNKNKVAMYKDIYKLWSEKDAENAHRLDKTPRKVRYINTLLEILNSPAPSFYLSKETIVGFICKPIRRR